MAVDAGDARQLRLQAVGGKAGQMLNDAGVGAVEILLEPDIDARDDQFAVFDPRPTGVIDVGPRRRLQQRLAVRRRERRGKTS